MMWGDRGCRRYSRGCKWQFCRSMGYRGLGRVDTMVDCKRRAEPARAMVGGTRAGLAKVEIEVVIGGTGRGDHEGGGR